VSDDMRGFFNRMAGEVRPRREVPPRMLQRASRRRVRSVLVLGAVAALVGYGGFAAVQAVGGSSPTTPGTATACSWHRVPSPNVEPDRLDNQLDGVFAAADDDVWAVGVSYVNEEGGENQPLAMHWDGTEWRSVPLPTSPSPEAGLLDVDGSSSDNIWAVGLNSPALHWDGAAWSAVPFVDPGATYWHIEAISVRAADDVWAVGNTAGGNAGGSLVEHWDGSKWTVVDSPSPPPDELTADAYPSLSAVDALTADDAWATGQTENVAPVGQSNTVSLHWDGSAWTRTDTPDVQAQNGVFGHLLGVDALASDDVWAVGIAADQPGTFGGGDRALIEHWDGASWTVSETLPADSRLTGAAAVSTDDAWAVGSTGYSGTFAPLILRWNGSAWDKVPFYVNSEASLSEVSVSPSGTPWAVGNIVEDGHSKTLTLRCS
jgi:hypothetical protein